MLAALSARESAQHIDEDVRADTTRGRPVTVRRVRSAIFAAAQETYREMWSEMKEKLNRRLGDNELAYYNHVAERRGSSERMTPNVITSQFPELVRRTEAAIGGAFKVPSAGP